MNLFRLPIVAFDAASAQTKSGIIAGLCGVLGVICGFVLYVVFTHMFEQGQVAAKLIGVGVGLVVSLGIASLAHRLWEAIDSGEFKLGGHSRRTFVAVISLVLVFELSASAFEDFARAVTGDFNSIKRIAAVIAGRDTARADGGLKAEGLGPLLDRLQVDAQAMGANESSVVKTPGARLIALMTDRDRYILFARELKPGNKEIDAAFIGSIGRRRLGPITGLLTPEAPLNPSTSILDPQSPQMRLLMETRGVHLPEMPSMGVKTNVAPRSRLDLGACENPGMGSFFRESTTADIAIHNAILGTAIIEDCRQNLLSLDDGTRTRILSDVMRELISRYGLFDADSFKRDTNADRLELSEGVRQTLQWQREQCDAIERSSKTAARMHCAEAASAGVAGAGSGVLIPFNDMRVLNGELLAAAFPGLIEPLPVYWWDMVLLFVMWCAAAVVVGVYLSIILVIEGPSGAFDIRALGTRLFGAFCALWVAGMIAAAALALVRLGPFVWQLMFDPGATTAHAVPGIFNIIPGVVRSLADGEFGFAIPAWLTLPALVLGAIVLWFRSFDRNSDGPNPIVNFALLGIVLSAVAPVLDGLLSVVLLMAGAWVVPTFGLALLSPYLKPERDVPQWWGVVALCGGLAVAFWVGLGLQGGDAVYRGTIAIAGLIAATTGALILRRLPMTELWPLLAITIGLFLVGGTAAFQQMTFAGVLKELHPVAHVSSGESDENVFTFLYEFRNRSADVEIPEGFRAPATELDVTQSLRLELALTGSIGFWLTLAMMVGWSLRRGAGEAQAGAKSAEHAPSV